MIVVTRQARIVLLRIRQRFRQRALEWEHAIMTVLWGLIVLGNPGQFDSPGFAAFIGGPMVWGWAITVLGTARIMALCVNGYMARPTALMRVLAGVSGILLFAAISLGFLFSWRWGTALAMYPVVGVFGLFTVYWAIFDVAFPDHHNDHAT
jgi:hypothetical protein